MSDANITPTLKSASYFLQGGADSRNVVRDTSDPFRPDFHTDDPAVFVAEAKRQGKKLNLIDNAGIRHAEPKPLAKQIEPRPVRRTTKPYDPTLGKVGSWVSFVFNREWTTGQVWSETKRGCVFIVDSQQRVHERSVGELAPMIAPVEEPTFDFDEAVSA